VLDSDLRRGRPALACAATWRSRKWRIAPDDYAPALRLIEAVCSDEVSTWDPRRIVEEGRGPVGPWHRMARAILEANQSRLERAAAAAKREYSPLGFRIVMREFALYMASVPYPLSVHLPAE
jgi:hypothetical protein